MTVKEFLVANDEKSGHIGMAERGRLTPFLSILGLSLRMALFYCLEAREDGRQRVFYPKVEYNYHPEKTVFSGVLEDAGINGVFY